MKTASVSVCRADVVYLDLRQGYSDPWALQSIHVNVSFVVSA